MKKTILESMQEHITTAQALADSHLNTIEALAATIIRSLKGGGRVYLCGNGGSASDAQHIASEILNRFKRERRALPAMALNADTSVLTAIANDYSYDDVFSKQVDGLVTKNDVLFCLSTSGNSRNLINAAEKAKELGACTIALLGKQGGKLKSICDHSLIVPSSDTARIQEMHITIGHILCDLIEIEFA